MQIFVKTETGKIIELDIDGSTTVADIKHLIASKEGIPVVLQRLVHMGEERENSVTFKQLQDQSSDVSLILFRRKASSVLSNLSWDELSNIVTPDIKSEIGSVTKPRRKEPISDYWNALTADQRVEILEEPSLKPFIESLTPEQMSSLEKVQPKPQATQSVAHERVKAIGLDIQDTLVVPGARHKRTGKTLRPAVDGKNTFEYKDAMASACFPEEGNDDWEAIPVINGASFEKTIKQLQELVARGVKLYLTTGDGKQGTARAEGSLGGIEVQKLLSENGIPTTIANWEEISETETNAAQGEGKNSLLQYAAKHSQIKNGELLFIDDGQKLIDAARRAGYQARCVCKPSDLTEALQYALDNSSSLKPEAARSTPSFFTASPQPLSQEFLQFLSAYTQAERHRLVDPTTRMRPSTEKYWGTLTPAQQEELRSEFNSQKNRPRGSM